MKNVKSNYMNYFKNHYLYQWDKNHDVFTITKYPLNISVEEFEFCIDQKGMDTFLKYNEPSVQIGKTLVVKQGKKKSEIKLSNEPLVMPNTQFDTEFSVDVEKIKIANKFVAKNDKKPILTGVNVANGYITATDSFFAYRTACECNCNVTIADKFINALKDIQGVATFKANKNAVCCQTEDTAIIGRLLDGQYPSLEKIYNAMANGTTCETSLEELKESLQFANSNDDRVVFEKNKISIIGEQNFESEINIGLECKIVVNCGYLNTIINSINNTTGNNININYTSEIRPLFFNSEYLLLPIREV